MTKTLSTLKFVGTISLGLLTGLSYTLSTIALPTLLTLPSASGAARAFTTLTGRALTQIRALATLSASSFFLAYLLSPRAQRHPYLLWTTLFVTGGSAAEYLLRQSETGRASRCSSSAVAGSATTTTTTDRASASAKQTRRMDASYEVLGDHQSDSAPSEHEVEGDVAVAGAADAEVVNGEEVRVAMEAFTLSQVVRTGLSGIALAMSVVGIWGDGSTESVILLEV